MHGVRAGGYYGPAGARKRSPQYTYLLRIFIIPATGIFIVTTLETSRPRPHRDGFRYARMIFGLKRKLRPKTEIILLPRSVISSTVYVNCRVQIKKQALEFCSCAIVPLTGRSCASKKMACTHASLSIHGMLRPQLHKPHGEK
ncbi:hypothetical protein ALC53_14028 [Atta colombica]|uniref:Uncharacterized protein n=1 Tax=Atta colombica TaxID=520822 RepID=A0A195AUA0_9HYME|nr:hypothetical protein ALC53_14028 [Atta colombica]